MKKLLTLVFLLAITITDAQQKQLLETLGVKKGIFGSISTGYSNPVGDYKSYSFSTTDAAGLGILGFREDISGGIQFNIDVGYQFSALGLSLSFGSFEHEISTLNFESAAFDTNFPLLINGGKIRGTYFGTGPDYNFSTGKFAVTTSTKIGFIKFSIDPFSGSYNGTDVSTPIELIKTESDSNSKSSLTYSSIGLKLSYNLSKNLNLFTKTDYFITFGEGLKLLDNGYFPDDINQDKQITVEDLKSIDRLQVIENERFIKPKALNFGVGLTYFFDKHKPKNNREEENVLNTNPKENSEIKNPKGSIVFNNTSKKDDKSERKLVNILPKNNAHYTDVKEINEFSWKVMGKPISNPNFIIEVTKVGYNRVERTFVKETKENSIKSDAVFKNQELREGQYMWKVTETSTGIISNPSFFSVSPCQLDFSITNDTIQCLGYEGENRKFKICFDSNYQSSTGNLTFANMGSGLTVYDQTYASLSYTLVSPNPTLVTQIGATPSTVSYCFEVIVPNSVTSIGFGLQGDDLDPSPIVCQPGVSSCFENLPDCLCDDCKEVELSFDDFSVSLNQPYGNQFNFNGNINVNIPVYGIEFQIQSYSYSANPNACSDGVSSVEESGMFLMPGTTINNSSSLQLFNETASGSPNTNNNATKDIKYTSSSPISGPIPVNLTIGLPGPLSGLDPSCCVIDYEVCIKVIIYYDENSCKSCVFTKCFQFNNQ